MTYSASASTRNIVRSREFIISAICVVYFTYLAGKDLFDWTSNEISGFHDVYLTVPGWLFAIAFLALFTIEIRRRAALVLDEEGIRMSSLFGAYAIHWCEVLRVNNFGHLGLQIVTPNKTMVVTPIYCEKAKELADLILESCKRRELAIEKLQQLISEN